MVTIYSKPQCPQCDATYRALDKKKIPYTKKQLTEQLTNQFKEQGFMSAPIVTTSNDSWSGFRPDKIAELATVTRP